MDQYEMLEHIKTHSLVVAKVAHLISKTLVAASIDVSVEITTVGALMHDIGKTASLKSGKDHSEIGRRICLENSLYEIADIVGEHVRLKDYCLENRISEKEIVYYSDKRVNHDQVVALKDRLAYILERYGRNREDICNAIRANFKLCEQIEQKLFKKLDFHEDRLPFLSKDEDILTHI